MARVRRSRSLVVGHGPPMGILRGYFQMQQVIAGIPTCQVCQGSRATACQRSQDLEREAEVAYGEPLVAELAMLDRACLQLQQVPGLCLSMVVVGMNGRQTKEE